MSYALVFAPDAKSQWLELDVRLQELVLDEADDMASHPPTMSKVYTRDVVLDEAGVRQYVFLRLAVERRTSTVTVIGVKHLSRRL
ncbi:MAG TPA: hypothetical protein VH370_22570 [Humisphaera sp.]|jgi:hypothetical protein|nr:hypothetical protein [Humisphaera sp.]